MSLRRKTYLLVGATLLVAAVAIFAVSQAVFVHDGQWTGEVLIFTLSLIGLVIILGAAVCWILEEYLFRRLARLTSGVQVGESGVVDLASIAGNQNDELSLLAEKIGSGFAELERTRTRQEQQAQSLTQALEELKVRHADLETAHKNLQQLAEVSASLGGSLEIRDALGQMEDVALGIFEADEVWLLRLTDDNEQLEGLRAYSNHREGFARLPRLFGCADPFGEVPLDKHHLLRTVFQGTGPVFIESVTELNEEEKNRLFGGTVPILAGFHSLGVVPLYFASGASSASQRAIGTGVVWGMLIGTFLSIFLVPIFFIAGKPELMEGTDVTGHVTDNFVILGYQLGKWVAENYPKTNCVQIPGFLGQGTAEGQIVGFNLGLTEGGNEECKVLKSSEWQSDKAIPIAQDLIASGEEFDVIFGANGETVRGILQVFDELGVKDKVVVSINGKEEEWEWLKDGREMASVPNPPSLNADLAVQQIMRHFRGEPFVQYLQIKPFAVITKDNVGEAVPWNTQNYLAGRATNSFKWQLSYYEEQFKANEQMFVDFDAKLAEYMKTQQ